MFVILTSLFSHDQCQVVTNYAIHYAGVSFTCKKAGNPKADVHTQASATKKENIAHAFGQQLARELIELEHEDKELRFKVTGLLSNANYNMRKVCSNHSGQ